MTESASVVRRDLAERASTEGIGRVARVTFVTIPLLAAFFVAAGVDELVRWAGGLAGQRAS